MTSTDPSDRLFDVDQIIAYSGAPLTLFIGISTAGSSVHTTFPEWAPLLAPSGVLRGVDLPENAAPDDFRRLVTAMRDNPDVTGAVVTSHKLRLHRAVSDLLDHADPLVDVTHEINSLDTRDGIKAFARDPQSLDIVLDRTGLAAPDPTRPIVCIGSGGSAIALLLAVGLDIPASIAAGRPVRPDTAASRGPLTILGRRRASLDEIRDVQARAGLSDADVKLVFAPGPDEMSAITSAAAPGTVVANATGLGKTSPGSPLTGPEGFAAGTLAWDFNYRGPLTFLQQAHQAGVPTENGWDYFLAGWAAALAAIGGVELTPERFAAVQFASRFARPVS